MKRNRKSHSESSKAPKRGVPRTVAQYNAKPERSREAYDRAVQVISKMRREKLSLCQASKDVGVNPQTVLRWGRSALKKTPSGRYTAKARDSLLRVLRLPSPEGTREIALRGSRQASTLGEYWAAVQKYLATGDSSGLAKFRDRQIKDASGASLPLITDPRLLKRLGSAGVLSFESIYARGV